MMELPPLFVGGVKVIVASVSPRVTIPIVGAPGTPEVGVTDAEIADGRLVPAEFVA